MQLDEFQFHDTRDYPVVRISGRKLPTGYGPQWVMEMDAFLSYEKPFVVVILDSAENPDHEDQKTLILWVKKNKKNLAKFCRGLISIEPDQATRLLKRVQGAAMALAFGLRMKFTSDLSEANTIAQRLLTGEDPPDVDGE